MKPAPRLLMMLISIVGAGGLAGCAAEPWVKPYERERLASPLMQPRNQLLAERHRAHVHEVREGARGATAVQGGGCGCN